MVIRKTSSSLLQAVLFEGVVCLHDGLLSRLAQLPQLTDLGLRAPALRDSLGAVGVGALASAGGGALRRLSLVNGARRGRAAASRWTGDMAFMTLAHGQPGLTELEVAGFIIQRNQTQLRLNWACTRRSASATARSSSSRRRSPAWQR